MSYTSTLVLLLHLIYLSYLSNVYRACSFFTNLDLFCIDNARVIYRKIQYFDLVRYVCSLKLVDGGLLVTSCSLHKVNYTQVKL